MTDSRDGQTYKTVKIGTQTWMAQNLNYETAGSYCYNDTSSYCAKYGRLYTWDAAVGKPTETEWETLFTAVGVQSIAGKVLKSMSGGYNGGNGTDAFSFSALPAGSWVAYTEGYVGGYDDEGYATFFWSSTEDDDSDYVYIMSLNDFDGDVYLNPNLKRDAYSVRCLKD